MKNFQFDKIVYRYIPTKCFKRKIEEVIGIDSEADTNGRPFLFCTSFGDSFTLDDIPHIFFTRRYRGTNFVVFNLQYDSGALLYNLPTEILSYLWNTGKAEWNGYRYYYIPHKHLRISKGKNAVKFWDIQQFFGTSLEKASAKYLGKHKIEMDTKNFTKEYIQDNFEKIKQYCIQDAILTKELADYLMQYLKEFGISISSLYSIASISFAYVLQEVGLRHVWNFWKKNREILQYACDSYAGGKFEVIARGRFSGYEYDINSAYPYEIANLKDIRHALYWKSTKYEKEADYGFLRVYIENEEGKPHPVAKKFLGVNIFPAGYWNATITKSEYIFLKEFGIKVSIYDAWWIKISCRHRPYSKVIRYLYEIKEKYKKKDMMLSYVAKIMMNSIYGKFAQMIESPDGKLIAGLGWNPIYASIICANVRCRMAAAQILYGKDCIAVHTDSIITKVPIHSSVVGDDIGQFQLREQGEGIIIASGIYEIGRKSAWRGFEFRKDYSWKKILEEMGEKTMAEWEEIRPLSWMKAMALKRENEINRFVPFPKQFDVNCDRKRKWLSRTNAKRLLEGLEYSVPHIVVEFPKK